jgi:hypothetical protein
MFFGSSRSGSDISQRKSPGLKIVDNRLNKRVSDIFNVKDQVTFYKPENYHEIKKMTAENNEERLNNKLRVIKLFIEILKKKKI